MASLPYSRRVRARAPATCSSAVSQETGTNSSAPRGRSPVDAPSSQPRRIIGRSTRSGPRVSRRTSPTGEGSGSSGQGWTAVTASPSISS